MRQEIMLATVYSPFASQLANGKMLLDDLEIQKLAARNGIGVGQLLQSLADQGGTVPLGKVNTQVGPVPPFAQTQCA